MERLSAELLEVVIGYLPDHLVVGCLGATNLAAWHVHRSAILYTEACWRTLLTYVEEQRQADMRQEDEAELRRQDDEDAQLAAFMAETYDLGDYSDDD